MTHSSLPCERVRFLLGVFVLGGLRGQQDYLVRTHLAGCVRCRAEYEELAEVPAFLDLLTPEEAAAGGDSADGAAPERTGGRPSVASHGARALPDRASRTPIRPDLPPTPRNRS
jgi:predicted anti-sigma-YlaC factor YlaD